ncbi:UDP-N-acetylmuramate dehydrogenase [Natroniella sp. ANB-PHB2]|uniref:UDP-N-acetylmuramate dehydrogenase n=1 Tax=Natroniella sp. ANB-PHB2 TaxID=3384444 RepID=UPI0038D418A5
MNNSVEIEKLCQKNVPLALHSSYQIGGKAAYFAEPETTEELLNLLNNCKKVGLDYYIFGYGTNILFPDQPRDNRIFISLKRYIESKFNNGRLFLSAGVPLSLISLIGVITNKTDFQFTYLLPGSVGAGIYINAKYYEEQICDLLNTIYYLDLTKERLSLENITVEQCEFDYKKSIFQNKSWLIVGADFNLVDCSQQEIKMINRLLSKVQDRNLNLSSLTEFKSLFRTELKNLEAELGIDCDYLQDINQFRQNRNHFKYPCCGSVFKNNQSYGISTGALVDELGLKGKKYGGAMIAPYHGNFIINHNQAQASDVLYLINLVTELIDKRYEFIPETEVIIVEK